MKVSNHRIVRPVLIVLLVGLQAEHRVVSYLGLGLEDGSHYAIRREAQTGELIIHLKDNQNKLGLGTSAGYWGIHPTTGQSLTALWKCACCCHPRFITGCYNLSDFVRSTSDFDPRSEWSDALTQARSDLHC